MRNDRMHIETLILGYLIGATLGRLIAHGEIHLPSPLELVSLVDLVLRAANMIFRSRWIRIRKWLTFS